MEEDIPIELPGVVEGTLAADEQQLKKTSRSKRKKPQDDDATSRKSRSASHKKRKRKTRKETTTTTTKPKADEEREWKQLMGKVFVSSTCYSCDAYQLVGGTKRFVKVRPVPMKHEGDIDASTWQIDWDKIASRDLKDCGYDDERILCTLSKEEDVYYIINQKQRIFGSIVEDGSTEKIHTVSY